MQLRATSPRKLNVLVVSHSFGFQQLMKSASWSVEIHIDSCKNCERALEFLPEQLPDAVLIDLGGMDPLRQHLIQHVQAEIQLPLVLVAENSSQLSYTPKEGASIILGIYKPALLEQLKKAFEVCHSIVNPSAARLDLANSFKIRR